MHRPYRHLALYHFDTCPFCLRVRWAMRDLGHDVELRNIKKEPRHLAELRAARGRSMVPVLRIEHDDGSVQWLGESRDIVAWLRAVPRVA